MKMPTIPPANLGLAAMTMMLATAAPARPAFKNDAVPFLQHQAQERYRLNEAEADFAYANTHRGYALLRQILDGNYDELATDSSIDGQDLVAVMWALYDSAARKGQAFDQGSLLVEDPQGHLFRFLWANGQRSERKTSQMHAATRLTGADHFRIDLLGSYEPGSRTWTPHSEANPGLQQQNLLPARKGAIQFIRLAADPGIAMGTSHVFIKLEDHGVKLWSEWFWHEVDDARLMARKRAEGMAGGLEGRQVPLAGRMKAWIKGPEKERRELLDEDLARGYGALDQATPPELRDGYARDLGLRAMRAHAERLLASLRRPEDVDDGDLVQVSAHDGQEVPDGDWLQVRSRMEQEIHSRATAFLAQVDRLKAERGWDHLEARTGSEVILAEPELRAAIEEREDLNAVQPAVLDYELDGAKDSPSVDELGWCQRMWIQFKHRVNQWKWW